MNKSMTKCKLHTKFRICIEMNYTLVSSGLRKKKITCVSFHTDFDRISFFFLKK